jgi:hypothetical protein
MGIAAFFFLRASPAGRDAAAPERNGSLAPWPERSPSSSIRRTPPPPSSTIGRPGIVARVSGNAPSFRSVPSTGDAPSISRSLSSTSGSLRVNDVVEPMRFANVTSTP